MNIMPTGMGFYQQTFSCAFPYIFIIYVLRFSESTINVMKITLKKKSQIWDFNSVFSHIAIIHSIIVSFPQTRDLSLT